MIKPVNDLPQLSVSMPTYLSSLFEAISQRCVIDTWIGSFRFWHKGANYGLKDVCILVHGIMAEICSIYA